MDVLSGRSNYSQRSIEIMGNRKDYHKEGYWKDWYWNKGGRDKVQYSRKITQPNNYNKRHGD